MVPFFNFLVPHQMNPNFAATRWAKTNSLMWKILIAFGDVFLAEVCTLFHQQDYAKEELPVEDYCESCQRHFQSFKMAQEEF